MDIQTVMRVLRTFITDIQTGKMYIEDIPEETIVRLKKVLLGDARMHKLHIDVETFSDVDLKATGVRKYVESPAFKIQLFAYAFDDDPVVVVDLERGEEIPEHILQALKDPSVLKLAYNAAFELEALNAYGLETPYEQWNCVSVKRAATGLPAKLGKALEALKDEGAPQKLPSNHMAWYSKPYGAKKEIHAPEDNIPKWEEYIEYNKVDVETERWLDNWLDDIGVEIDWKMWHLDQKINRRGIKVDTLFCREIVKIDETDIAKQIQRSKEITGLENPNSLVKLKAWFKDQGHEVSSLNAETVQAMLEEDDLPEHLQEVLKIRQMTSNTSTAKFKKMLDMEVDSYIYYTMQFYGAHTGRWAARGIQPHNMPRMYISEEDVKTIKLLVYAGVDPRDVFDDDIIKQMIRPTIVPTSDKFIVADFSAIEARVLAWLANEEWAMEVFEGDGKIYEAQAAMMYNIPLDEVTKEDRAKGKVATLALGYQGGVNALYAMGYEGSSTEAKEIVEKFRAANKKISKLWYAVDRTCKKAIGTGGRYEVNGLSIWKDELFLCIKLPSGRVLRYFKAHLVPGDKGDQIGFWGTERYSHQRTYGGRLVENIVQAIARDCLSLALWRLREKEIIFHVHDEVILENVELEKIIQAMEHPIKWAPGLVLKAAGYEADHFRKD